MSRAVCFLMVDRFTADNLLPMIDVGHRNIGEPLIHAN